jgi:hypothetical protein
LVLKPSFSQATGAEFIKLGDISVYDNRIDHGTTSTPRSMWHSIRIWTE